MTNRHTLLAPVTNDDIVPGRPMTRHACACGHWWRIRHESTPALLQEIESDHEVHRQLAGAEDLRNGITDEVLSPTLEGLVNIATALADAAAAGVRAMESLQEFVDAHKDAKDRGIGVTVVRQQDGSITTTPNVFVEAGTAVFMDSPAITNLRCVDDMEARPLRLVLDSDCPPRTAYALYEVPAYQPSYTVVTDPSVA